MLLEQLYVQGDSACVASYSFIGARTLAQARKCARTLVQAPKGGRTLAQVQRSYTFMSYSFVGARIFFKDSSFIHCSIVV